MSRKFKKGYYVRGHFVAEGSELDLELKRELKGGGEEPSKTELKAQSSELQGLGEDLLGLRRDLFEALELPSKLLEALEELKRITNFEGRRRQSQFVGKLMRKLDEEEVESIRVALEVQRKGSAKETLLLHSAEDWRERLIKDDTAVAAWIEEFPQSDSQQLRALVRQIRKDAPPAAEANAAESKGLAPRKTRAWRELFQLVREQLAEPDDTEGAADTDTDPDTPSSTS
ncbi:ribosome biogenesis factor YjgA [Ottowia thiooxydans]|uniref:ribosome biogenesis factor YjgA n=1 Tax=Ottowia thiooxydans TaxID=219182 RepID=UPI000415F99F|nr:ribosome biogenesis factor YjgA [Ottowia thiooxydans]